jgi:hypothetical protein
MTPAGEMRTGEVVRRTGHWDALRRAPYGRIQDPDLLRKIRLVPQRDDRSTNYILLQKAAATAFRALGVLLADAIGLLEFCEQSHLYVIFPTSARLRVAGDKIADAEIAQTLFTLFPSS